MTMKNTLKFFVNGLVNACVLVLLTACGGGGGSGTTNTPASEPIVNSSSSSLTASEVSSAVSSIEPRDTTPDFFEFTPALTLSWNTAVISNTITVSGINAASAISITNGQYSIDGGTYTDATGLITNGQTVTVQTMAAATPNTTTHAILDIGGVVRFFDVTTKSSMGGASRGEPLNLTGLTSTFAGRAPIFKRPMGVATDGTNLYVTDSDNNTIRKIVIATGETTALAGRPIYWSAPNYYSKDGIGENAQFIDPRGITTDGTNLYVTDVRLIRKIVITTGEVTTLSSIANDSLNDITTDGTNLYVAGRYTVRKIVIATGENTLLAGREGTDGSVDGTSDEALFYSPNGIATDGTNVYVGDWGNNTIRKIVIATGKVTTLAGKARSPGSTDGTGAAARFNFGGGLLTTDGTNLFVADTGNHTIRKIVIATGEVTTLAGTAGSSGSTDGIGAAARFNRPIGITTDGTNFYVADTANNSFRKIVIATKTVETIIGSDSGSDGTWARAHFGDPQGITTDGTNLYVADRGNCKIRKIVIATREVSTLAGNQKMCYTSDWVVGAWASFKWLSSITTDGTNLYVADDGLIRKIVISTTEVTTLAEPGGPGMTTDGTNLYVTSNYTIRKIVIATGEATTLAGTAGSPGSDDGIGAAAHFIDPRELTTDGTNLYVADYGSNTIRKIVIATGEVTTLAGDASVYTPGNTDGTGKAARFYGPTSLTTDGTNLYVTDLYNNAIRKIVIATGEVTTLAVPGGPGMTTDGVNLYVTDSYDKSVIIFQSSLENSSAMSSLSSSATSLSSSSITSSVASSTASTVASSAIVVIQSSSAASSLTLASSASSMTSSLTASNASSATNSATPVDTTPDAFSFTAVTGAAVSTETTSNTVTVSGINTATPISIINGQYSIDGGIYTSAAGTVTNGQTVSVKAIAAATPKTTIQTVLTIGGVTRAFAVTTAYSMGGAIQGKSLNLAAVVSTLSGRIPGTDGNGAAASFNYPIGITTDGANLYVADTNNSTVRKIVIATGDVTTLAGTAGYSTSTDGTGAAANFNSPHGITTDGTNLYVVDSNNHTIRKIVIATGEVTTLAGTAGSSGSSDGIGAAAHFNNPNGITTDGTHLYVVDSYNHTIRKIVIATRNVTTLAGTVGSSGIADGVGTAARFNFPQGIITDGTNLYVADSGNHTIRKIVISTGDVTTLTGTAGSGGSTDGTGAAARFNSPRGITIDGTNLYVADTYNHAIRKIVIATGEVTTLAGSAALFGGPEGLATDGTNLYVTDSGNNIIRKIVIAANTVDTIAGSAYSDGAGAAASFDTPEGLTTDGTNLYVADFYNNTIRKIVIVTGSVTTLAGEARHSGSADGTGAAAGFYLPHGLTTDGANLYVADTFNSTIRKIVIATGDVTTLAGSLGSFGSTDGIGTAAGFNLPHGLTTDGASLYVADTFNSTIRKIAIATGDVTTLAGSAGSSGGTDGTGAAARFNFPQGLTTDGTNLYVADSSNHTIRKIVIATGEVTTIAGTAGSVGITDGTGAAASFNFPQGITTDGTNLYVADFYNNTIRKIVIATGDVTTLAGLHSGTTDGTGAAARFYSPNGITTDGTNLYVADTRNNTIRKIH